jgi:hypothetical protein
MVKRKQIAPLLLLLAGIALWLTQGHWLPLLLAQLPLLEERSTLLQALDALVNLLIVVFNILMAYLVWASRSEEKAEQEWELEPLRRITPQGIRRGLGEWGGRVNWIDRHATHVADLRTHGRVVITGRMKIGKTREAAELIRRAVAEDLVAPDHIYEPAPVFRFLSDASLREALRRSLDPQAPTLLFVDDLPYQFPDEALEQLTTALDVLRECKAAYVVATARTDQLTEAHRAWLQKRGFHVLTLPDMDAEQTGRLVDNAAGLFGLQVEDAARAVFVAERDGTPELTLMALRRLRTEGATQVDEVAARRVARESLLEGWPKRGAILRSACRRPALCWTPWRPSTPRGYAPERLWCSTTPPTCGGSGAAGAGPGAACPPCAAA